MRSLSVSFCLWLSSWEGDQRPERFCSFCVCVQSLSDIALNISKAVTFCRRQMPIIHKESGTEPLFMLSKIICEANKNCVWIHRLEEHFRPATCIHWAFSLRKHPHLGFYAHLGKGIAWDKVSLVLSSELRVWRGARWFISLTEPEMWAAWHCLLTSAQYILRFKRISFPYPGLLWPSILFRQIKTRHLSSLYLQRWMLWSGLLTFSNVCICIEMIQDKPVGCFSVYDVNHNLRQVSSAYPGS